ncbi:hypothetical protein SNE35_16775 [Paucibacter sp. R3-3]|uniref:Uncharacterized protein n=1 Tax=Roseateles agri TaxID=3098619 RepID=A0ABU5DKF6_9BURK|nr:hypothetical protein [Paucibacter sp. R3-3]MDY0746175.1 hypothetical protein [Paucibacter sp. R3-3]
MKIHTKRWLARGAAALALTLVFLAYTQPALMTQLSQQLWACF